ncbi:MAG: PQQ-dependent sugar dehydrogenase [Deltaproteobacteria bacterium]|nr:PQQ-dependent sugar dehydrogenase [Deltaproteobacteria bacterium]
MHGIDRDDAADVLRRAVGLSPTRDCLPHLQLTAVVRNLDQPLFVGAADGDDTRLYVVEQPGRIRLVKNGTLTATPFLDIADAISAGGERGLLGLALHPQYVTNGRFFVNYTNPAGDTVIAEYRRSAGNPDVAAPEAARVFFTVTQPFANHNGGMVAFGADGFLYIGLGDGGGGDSGGGGSGGGGDPLNNGQSLDTKLGKILRIDVDTYPTPPAGNVTGGDPDIWDFGLRNPFRFSFDRGTGDLYIGDVGQDRFEEVDLEPRGGGGRNYGWRITEGTHCFNPPTGCNLTGITLPVAEYGHEVGCSVIGGYVYRGRAIPGIAGRYLYGDFCSNRIWSFTRDGAVVTSALELTDDLDPTHALRGITSFGEDADGEIYVVDGGSGVVFRVDPE